MSAAWDALLRRVESIERRLAATPENYRSAIVKRDEAIAARAARRGAAYVVVAPLDFFDDLGAADDALAAALAASPPGARTPTAHKTSHENGGSDEIDVGGLSGVLADPQHPIIGSAANEAVAGNDARLTDARTPTAHGSTHLPGAADEIFAEQTGWTAGAHSTLRSLANGASLSDTQDYLLTLVADLLARTWPTA